MTGTGTQTDPYKVSSWDELASLGSRTGYIEASKENDVWDLNKTNPEGVSAQIGGYGYSSYFDGKGLKILNAYIPSSKSYFICLLSCTVKNVDFLNFDCRSGECFEHGGTFNNCRFSGKVYGSKLFDGSGNRFFLNRCSLNVELQNSSNIGSDLHFVNSHLKIDSSANDALFESQLRLDNSYFEGDLTNIKVKLINYYSQLSQYSIINAKAKYLDTTAALNKVLYNSDLLISGGSVSSALTPVTAAQLGDAEYLASIGFPIGVD